MVLAKNLNFAAALSAMGVDAFRTRFLHGASTVMEAKYTDPYINLQNELRPLIEGKDAKKVEAFVKKQMDIFGKLENDCNRLAQDIESLGFDTTTCQWRENVDVANREVGDVLREKHEEMSLEQDGRVSLIHEAQNFLVTIWSKEQKELPWFRRPSLNFIKQVGEVNKSDPNRAYQLIRAETYRRRTIASGFCGISGCVGTLFFLVRISLEHSLEAWEWGLLGFFVVLAVIFVFFWADSLGEWEGMSTKVKGTFCCGLHSFIHCCGL